MPPQIGGIALNMVALASLMELLADIDVARRWLLQPLRSVVLVIATVLTAMCAVRFLAFDFDDNGNCVSLLWRELHSLRTTAAHGAALVAMQTTGAKWFPIVGAPAMVLVYVAGSLNLLLFLHFGALALRRGAEPEPFWYPATVSIGTLALVVFCIATSFPRESWPCLALPRASCSSLSCSASCDCSACSAWARSARRAVYAWTT